MRPWPARSARSCRCEISFLAWRPIMVCPLPQQNETPGTAAKKVKSNDMDRKGRGKRGVFCFFFQNAARKVGKKIHRGLSFWARSNFACPLHLHRFSFSVQAQLQNWAGERTNEREFLVLRRRVPLAGFLVLLGVLLLGLLLLDLLLHLLLSLLLAVLEGSKNLGKETRALGPVGLLLLLGGLLSLATRQDSACRKGRGYSQAWPPRRRAQQEQRGSRPSR